MNLMYRIDLFKQKKNAFLNLIYGCLVIGHYCHRCGVIVVAIVVIICSFRISNECFTAKLIIHILNSLVKTNT